MAAPKQASSLLSVAFNQTQDCLSVGTRNGYSIYGVEPYGRLLSEKGDGRAIVEMLFQTSLVALVGTADSSPQSSPRRLEIVNTKRQTTICSLLFPTAVLAVKLNRQRVVVVTETEIFIYSISTMRLLHTIETSPNPQAVCALTPCSEPCYLAYPSPVPSPTSPFANNTTSTTSMPGDVLIFDLTSLTVVNIIQAHKTPISCLAFNSTGTMLATASDKGTVVRVFSVPGAQKLYQFRRGSRPARIYNISFNAVSTLLCVSSDTETVHIFKLAGQSSSNGNTARPAIGPDSGSSPTPSFEGSEASSAGPGGYEAFISDKKKGGGLSGTLRRRSMAMARAAGGVSSYLPGGLSEMWEPSRDFAYLKLPTAGVSSVVALSSTTPQVLVATSEGFFYSYNIDLENGGECSLTRQYSLLESEETSNGAASSMAE
ncbi:WD40 repeat-like protein [Ceraceosorus guamensis]|uniref:Autophagy-related protein 18 n=1 Tax=Ceraceosorus guamensis TaxID=1522189 RepID=A0A316VSE6_9BASI|nr:WD40 repeat-like protein [Ceraceosorus guamensis]PWN40517.1 WD40 repeat-like protein [Ceraceosorus guamensis]